MIGDSSRRERYVQQLVLDRVNPLLEEQDRLEIRGGGVVWGVFRRTDPDERGPNGERFTVNRDTSQTPERLSFSVAMVSGYRVALGHGLGTWIPLTPHPIRVKLALIEALENAALVASGLHVTNSDPAWPQPGAVARTRLHRDRVECWYENPATHQRWDVPAVRLAEVPRR